MEVGYRRSSGKSYMVITGGGECPGYQLEMCKRNTIAAFLEFETVVADGQLEFWYDITGKQSLEEYVKDDKLGSKEILQLITAVYTAMKEVENYLLQEEAVLFLPRYIFVTNGSKEVKLCYCPGEKQTFAQGFHALMEYLLTYINHEEERAVTISYRIYQMTLEANYSMESIWQFLRKTLQTDRKQEDCEKNKIQEERYVAYVEEEKPQNESLLERWKVQGKKLVKEGKEQLLHRFAKERTYENEIVFEPMENRKEKEGRQTIFLGQDREKRKMIRLIYLGEEAGRDVELKNDIYCVGSQEDADIMIPDGTISRLHARLNKDEGIFYIEDLNSRNGTCVNGKLLHYMEKIPLKHDDIIAFADERYRYEEIN